MSINERIVLGDYQAALALIVDEKRKISSQSLLNEDFLNFVLTHGSEEVLYPLFLEYVLRYEDRIPLYCVLNVVRSFFEACRQRQIPFPFTDFAEDLIAGNSERDASKWSRSKFNIGSRRTTDFDVYFRT